MRRVIAVLLFVAIVPSLCQVVSGQDDPRDRRRRLLDGVLKSLINSQLDDRNGPIPPPSFPTRQPVDAQHLRDARGNVQQFTTESARLVHHLRQEERANSNLRPLLSDALRVQAASSVLLQRSPSLSESRFAAEFASLDRQWRNTSHQLRHAGLGSDSLASIKRMDAYDAKLCELLNVEPQVDRTELVRICAVLGRDLQNLLQDISFDIRTADTRHELLLDTRKLKTEIDSLGVAASRTATHAQLVEHFQQSYNAWRNLAARIRKADNIYLNRSVARIEESNDRIHNLLWLDKGIDQGELLALTRGMQKDLVALARDITAADLLTLKDPEASLAGLKTVLTSCGSLEASIIRKGDLDALLWDIRLLGVEWDQTKATLQPLERPEIQRNVANVDEELAHLGDVFGQGLHVDEQATITLAASVDDVANHLYRKLPNVLGNRYPRQYRAAVSQAADDFHEQAHRFHDDLLRRRDAKQLRDHCLELVKSWEALVEQLNRLQPTDRAAFDTDRARVSQDLARLQILNAL